MSRANCLHDEGVSRDDQGRYLCCVCGAELAVSIGGPKLSALLRDLQQTFATSRRAAEHGAKHSPSDRSQAHSEGRAAAWGEAARYCRELAEQAEANERGQS